MPLVLIATGAALNFLAYLAAGAVVAAALGFEARKAAIFAFWCEAHSMNRVALSERLKRSWQVFRFGFRHGVPGVYVRVDDGPRVYWPGTTYASAVPHGTQAPPEIGSNLAVMQAANCSSSLDQSQGYA